MTKKYQNRHWSSNWNEFDRTDVKIDTITIKLTINISQLHTLVMKQVPKYNTVSIAANEVKIIKIGLTHK